MKKIIYSLPLLLALGACSSEEGLTPEVPSTPEGNSGYYLTMKFDVPTELAGTRAGETLGGEDNEWKLTSIDLYLLDNEATGKYNVLWKKEGIAVTNSPTNPTGTGVVNKKYNVKTQLSITTGNDELAALGELKGHDVTVLVVCNPDQYNGYTKFNKGENVVGKTYSLPLTVEDGTPTAAILDFGTGTGGQEMPMSNHNASAVITAFKGLQGTGEALTAEIRNLFTIENGDYIYNLTSGTDNEIAVERAVARLDLSPNTTEGNFKGTFKYDLNDGTYGDSGINLELYSVQPFNVNNTSYIVRHGSETGDAEAAKSALTLWGAGDANANWIGDPNWGEFSTSSYFTESTRPVYNQLSKNGNIFSIPTGDNTNDPTIVSSTFTSSRHQTGDYYNWCYVTENTLPSITAMASDGLELNATGVLFKFQVLDTEGHAITTTTESTKFPTGVAKTSEGKLVVVLQRTGKKMEIAPEGNDYFMAYPGYITHNPKDSSASTLNPMNYGVVRNTVYQLKVNSISTLPDPEDPDYYLTLDINVLNWKSKQVGFEF